MAKKDIKKLDEWLESSRPEAWPIAVKHIQKKIEEHERKSFIDQIIAGVKINWDWNSPEEEAEYQRILPKLCDVKLDLSSYKERGQRHDRSHRYEMTWNEMNFSLHATIHQSGGYNYKSSSTRTAQYELMTASGLQHITKEHFTLLMAAIIESTANVKQCESKPLLEAYCSFHFS
jgi:hypothetical protein